MAKAEEGAAGGMQKADLRKFLKFAKKAPVQVAFAVGSDGKAVIQLDKRKQPRSLEKLIKSDSPGSKNHRFGQLLVDPEQPKLARFVVNKAGGGLARKLIVALKGTGFNQVEIVLEDGTSVESDAGEEEEESGDEGQDEDEDHDEDEHEDHEHEDDNQNEDRGNQPSNEDDETPSNNDEPAPEQDSDTSGQGTDTPDAKKLAQDLTMLVKEMMAAIGKDPSLKVGLTDLAVSAQIALKKGELAQAEADMDIMRRALGDAVASDSTGNDASKGGSEETESNSNTEDDTQSGNEDDEDTADEQDTSQSNAGAEGDDQEEPEEHRKRRHRRVHKSHRAWMATRDKIEGEIEKLKKQIVASHDDDSFGDKLADNLTSALGPVLESLEHGLEQVLAQAAKAHSRQEHDKLMKEAKHRMVKLRASVQSNTVIVHIDSNPFMPMQLGKTISSTLDTLGGALGL